MTLDVFQRIKPGRPFDEHDADAIGLLRSRAKRWAKKKGRAELADDFAGYVCLRLVSDRGYGMPTRLWADFLRATLGDTREDRKGADEVRKAIQAAAPIADEPTEEWPGVVVAGDLGEARASVGRYLEALGSAGMNSTEHALMVLQDVHGFSAEELGRIFNMVPGTVHVHRSRAIKKVRVSTAQ